MSDTTPVPMSVPSPMPVPLPWLDTLTIQNARLVEVLLQGILEQPHLTYIKQPIKGARLQKPTARPAGDMTPFVQFIERQQFLRVLDPGCLDWRVPLGSGFLLGQDDAYFQTPEGWQYYVLTNTR